MDITTILGLLIGIVLIVFVGIKPAVLGTFWDPQSVAIVLGGTISALISSYPLSMLKTVPKHFKMIIQGNKYNIGALVDTLEEMAQLARKNGLLALEEKANEIEDPFFKSAIMLIVDATEPEEVRSLLENEIDAMSDRHGAGIGFYEKGSAVAPAFGMIGTLVGLVNMLKAMNIEEGGAGDLGPAMATANKLKIRNEDELLYKQVMIEGILAIQAGDNPKFLKEKLVTYVSQKERGKILNQESGGKKEKEE